MDAHIIVISGLSYTGSSTLAKGLSISLKWDLTLAGDRFREYCNEQGLNYNIAKQIPDDIHKCLDNRLVLEMQTNTQTVFEGRIAIWLASKIPYTLKIWCQVDIETRITRCGQREGFSHKESAELTDSRDRSDSETYEMLYNIKIGQLPEGVLVVDTGVPVENCIKQILKSLT